MPVAAPAHPAEVTCTDASSCITMTQGTSSDASCASILTATFSNACQVRFVCKACPANGATVYTPACQTMAVPPAGPPPASVSFCGAAQVKWKCAAEGEHDACLAF